MIGLLLMLMLINVNCLFQLHLYNRRAKKILCERGKLGMSRNASLKDCYIDQVSVFLNLINWQIKKDENKLKNRKRRNEYCHGNVIKGLYAPSKKG